MTTLDDLRRAHQAQMDAKQDVLQSWPALLGRVSDQLVDVAARPGYAHIRIGSDETAGQARNKKVPSTYDLAVYVGYDGISPEFQVLSTRQEDWVAAGYPPVPEVGPHGATHTWPTEGDAAADGSDVTYVAWRQILSLRIGTIAAFTVEVGRGPLFRIGTGQWEWIATQNINLAGDQPGIGARWVLVYLDSAGVLQRRLGAIIAPSNALLFTDCPAPLSEEFPLAAVRLYATQTAITETRTVQDVIDLRFQASGGGGTALPAYAQGSIIYGDATDWAALAHPGAANRVLQSTAAEVGWSAGSLVLGGFTLTIPATGTAALGTGAANRAAYWTGANTLAGEAQLALSRGGSAADLSATGGAGEYVKQAGAGAAFTVGVIAVADLPAHDILSATHGDTTPAAVVRGDLMTGQGVAPSWARLAHPGVANRVLQSTALEIGWSANAVTFPAAGAVPVGAGANTQIVYWTGANTLAGDAGLVYNAATDTITIAGAINPVAAAGQNLGDATHRWDVFGSYVDLPDEGWIGATAALSARITFDYTPAPNEITVGDAALIMDKHNILPGGAGQDLGSAAARWDVFGSYVDLPNAGWIGIAGNETLTVNAAGTMVFSGCNVGIGVVPLVKLDVSGNLAVANTNAYQSRDAGGIPRAMFYMAGNIAGAGGDNVNFGNPTVNDLVLFTGGQTPGVHERIIIAAAGSVTITNLGGGGNQDVGADNNGLLYVPFVSDAKFKMNIEQLTGGLAAIRLLRGVTFEWNKDALDDVGLDFGDCGLQAGMIAGEVGEAIPLAYRDGPKYGSFDSRAITPYLVEAIKELDTRLEKLEAQ